MIFQFREKKQYIGICKEMPHNTEINKILM
jgi:hypothetical protein